MVVGKKLSYAHIWGKNEKMLYFLEIALNSYLEKFHTYLGLHWPKEALNALRKIQFTIGTNF